MFQRTKVTAAMSQELIDELTDRGRRDLSRLRMDDLETEVYELVDAITRRTVRGLLEEQVAACDQMPYCRQCGRELDDKPPEEKTLTTARGEVTWNQPVKRCSACRCDFFPSGPSVGD
jgi:hypothetical protein